MSEMIERVARALMRSNYSSELVDELWPSERLNWCDHARAAIAAMREPTADMLTPDGSFDLERFEAHRADDDAAIWRRMIDAALDPTP